jgi:hypothetical protein
MGERRVMQEALFYGFSLKRHVPDNGLEPAALKVPAACSVQPTFFFLPAAWPEANQPLADGWNRRTADSRRCPSEIGRCGNS